MNFRDVFRNLTGISTPFFGVSWETPISEKEIAKRILVFLEGRRVLYEPEYVEVAIYCIDSVLQIRDYLTIELQNAAIEADINLYIREMRMACNMFLSNFRKEDYEYSVPFFKELQDEKEIEFLVGLITLRKVFSSSIKNISKKYQLSVHGPLNGIL